MGPGLMGPSMRSHPRHVIAGHRRPLDPPPTVNEQAWLEFLRDLTHDADPPVSLRMIQALRLALAAG